MPGDMSTPAVRRSRRYVILAVCFIVLSLVAWLQHRALASLADTYQVATERLTSMRADAVRILALEKAPQAAAGRTRASEDLLAQIEQSLSAAGIDRSRWHDSIPQPPTRIPRTDYKQLTTRIYLQSIALRDMAAFILHLQTADPTLRVSAIDLTNRHAGGPNYDVDLAVSYLVYAPEHARP